MNRARFPLHALVALAVLAITLPKPVAGIEVTLADQGQATMPIVMAADAGQTTKRLAATLSDYLSRISGADFVVAVAPGKLPERRKENSPQQIQLSVQTRPNLTMFETENYVLRSDAAGLLLRGASEAALEHAVWDLLHRLGHRQFFPGEVWEVVPRRKTLQIEVNANEQPDYHFRRIWYGFGTWGYNQQPWEDWARKNRLGGSLQVQSGHAYGGIIRAKQQAFDQHAEYYALVDGRRDVRAQAKLCIGNPSLRQLVVDYAQETFRKNPQQQCVSMDPSDGGGWCECEACQKIGSPSDRALLLANQVAAAVKPKFVGLYAYNYHSPPPSIRAVPNVCVNVATAFVKGGQSIDDVMAGWSSKGATIGIREYYSVNTWDRDLPGAARGSNLQYLASTIPDFHRKGARFLNAESSDNWGCNGLGYYFAARTLWDITAAERRDEIVDDFLIKAFGPAHGPMAEFYALLEGSNTSSRLVYEDLLGRMFRLLHKAQQLTPPDSNFRRRINALILYARYVELFDRYRKAGGEERQRHFEAMIKHAYRMRSSMMVHSKAIYRDVPARDRRVSVPDGSDWQTAEAENAWKSSRTFDDAELSSFVQEGMAKHRLVELDFEPREYDEELRPTAPLRLGAVKLGAANRGRGKRSWHTYRETPGDLVLNITGGLIAHYRDRGNVKVRVWQIGGAGQAGEQTTLIATDASVPPDGKERTVRISIKQPGHYRIDLDDGMDMTQVTWPRGQAMTVKMALDDQPRMLTGRWSLWFYVPKGAERVGLYANTSKGALIRPDGKTAATLEKRSGEFFSASVPTGMDGKLWQLQNVAGNACLLNAPPYLARSADELLLPRTVIDEPKSVSPLAE